MIGYKIVAPYGESLTSAFAKFNFSKIYRDKNGEIQVVDEGMIFGSLENAMMFFNSHCDNQYYQLWECEYDKGKEINSIIAHIPYGLTPHEVNRKIYFSKNAFCWVGAHQVILVSAPLGTILAKNIKLTRKIQKNVQSYLNL